MYDFNADEIFSMAQQIERNGAAFYRKSAAEVSQPAAKELLLGLAAMEDEHEKTFARLKKDLTPRERENTAFDPDNEAGQYLRALADTRVFFEKEIPDPVSMVEILKSAILAEKDSIVFYLGMREWVPEKLGKDRVDGIIKEEMNHVRILSKELISLEK